MGLRSSRHFSGSSSVSVGGPQEASRGCGLPQAMERLHSRSRSLFLPAKLCGAPCACGLCGRGLVSSPSSQLRICGICWWCGVLRGEAGAPWPSMSGFSGGGGDQWHLRFVLVWTMHLTTSPNPLPSVSPGHPLVQILSTLWVITHRSMSTHQGAVNTPFPELCQLQFPG